MQTAAAPPTCPADTESSCGSGEWEGEFFPGISKIKYEVKFLICILFSALFFL